METIPESNNRELVASLYKRYYGDLLAYLTAYTHDVMEAEDMLQELFVKVLSLDVITEATAKSLLLVMTRRMITDDARHKAFLHRAEKGLAYSVSQFDSYSVVHKLEADEVICKVRSIVSSMPAKRAEIYEMYRRDGFTAQEIAERLNISRRTVETHVYLASRTVRRRLRGII